VTSCSEFNGDGYADLAVGGFGKIVNVMYGSASGFGAAGNETWSRDSPGIQWITGSGRAFRGLVGRGDSMATASPIWRWQHT
jgi:hypothetical protein